MRRAFLLSLISFAVSCGKPPDPVIPATPCEDAALTQALELPVGGHATLAAPEGSKVTDIEVVSSGAFTATKLDRARWDLKAPYESADATVKLFLHCGDPAGEAELHATTRAPKWSPLSQWTDPAAGFPPNREYGVMWLDGEDRILVYGGFHYLPMQFTPSTDLWSFDLKTNTWAELQSTNAPQYMGGRIAQLPGSRQVLFLGGVTSQFEPIQHLERFDPETLKWTAQAATGARTYGDYQPGLVFDSKRGRFLSVCGQSDTVHCRVSELVVPADGPVAWRELAVQGAAPEGRAGHFFTYDAQTDRVIIFAGMGASQRIIGDTWALEVESLTWVKLADERDDLKRRNGAFTLDAPNHRLIVWGGTPDGLNASGGVQLLDLDRGHEAWHRLDPEGGAPARASAAAVYDAKRKRLVAGFGNSSAGGFADLWSLDL